MSENKTSAAQIRATRKYEKEHYWKITILLPKEYKDRIKATGESGNGFIRKAVEERLARIDENNV